MATNFHKVKKGINLEPQAVTPSNLEAGDLYFDGYLAQLQFTSDGYTVSSVGSVEVQSDNTVVTPFTTKMNFGPNFIVTDNGGNKVTIDTATSGLTVTGGNVTVDDTYGFENSTAGSSLRVGSSGNTSALYIGDGSNVNVVNVGTGSGATTINLGGVGDTVNIAGTLNNITTTNTNVTDKLITINKGGSAGSGNASGFAVEENGILDGYIFIGNSRSSWDLIAPASLGTVRLTPSPGAYVSEITSNLTSNKSYTLPDQLDSTSDNLITRTSNDTAGGRLKNKNLDASNVHFVDATDTSKTIAFLTGGGASGKQLVLASTVTADRIVTFPDANTTLLGTDNTATVSNKIINNTNTLAIKDNSFDIQSNVNITRLLEFSLSGSSNSTLTTIATSSTANRTITLPDATGTLIMLSVLTISSNITLTSGTTYLVDTSAPRTLTLPTATNNTFVVIKDKSGISASNNITLSGGGANIDGLSTQVLAKNYGSWTAVSDGTNWYFTASSTAVYGA